MRTSPNVEAATPNTSGPAHARAQSSTRSNPNRRPKSATTGSAPSIFSTLGAPYRARRPSTADRATPDHQHDQLATPAQPHQYAEHGASVMRLRFVE